MTDYTNAADGDAEKLDCAAVIADIWTILDNECAPDARERLQHHIDTCPPCLEHYGIEAQVKSLINRKCGGDAAPDGLRERLKIQIREQTTTTPERKLTETVVVTRTESG